jgi:hypothetical protein
MTDTGDTDKSQVGEKAGEIDDSGAPACSAFVVYGFNELLNAVLH